MEERVFYQLGSISTIQRRHLQRETSEEESTQEAQRLELEDIENQELFKRSTTKSRSVSKRKQSTSDIETEEQDSTSTRRQNNLQREIGETASVLTRKKKSLLREMEERKSMHGGALRLELESKGCKDMKMKALPDEVEAETFLTKGCQYDYVENIKHSKKSMSFRNFVAPHKGLVLVIVNYSFPNKPLERGNDIEEIEQLFPDYGYEVHSFTDLSKENILSKVKLCSEKENVDRFICFISSHGNQTSLACPDGGVVRINDILSAANTKQLENKPKVFFFDACRANLNQDIKESDLPEPPSAEYYVGFSCLASKISLVGKNSCGIYFQALIEVFKDGFWRSPREESKIRDINHFMAKVHHRVNKQKDKQGNNYQMPIYRSTLTGLLFLQGDRDVSDTLHNISIY